MSEEKTMIEQFEGTFGVMAGKEMAAVEYDRDQSLREKLTVLLNQHSQENGSDTPDWILANYLLGCLSIYNTATCEREKYYGREVGVTGWAPRPERKE